MRAIRLLACLVVLLVSVTPAAGTAASSATGPFELRLDEGVFWDGEHVAAAAVPDRNRCNVTGRCWRYQLVVTEPAWRLRVALGVVFPGPDHVRPLADSRPSPHFGSFDLVVYTPGGQVAAQRQIRNGYDVEALLTPQVGTWTVEVVPVEVVDLSFRLRAILQSHPEPPEEQRLALPNLRIIPPFEIGFSAPTATYGPGAPAPAGYPTCMLEEYAEAQDEGFDPPTMCLRFSMGVENAGEGPLTLLLKCPTGGTIGCDAPISVRQQMQVVDPAVTAWPHWRCCELGPDGGAGTARFHPFHLHNHYDNAYVFELLRVTDPSWRWGPGAEAPPMAHAGPGRKLGVQPVEERMHDWREFTQHAPNCCHVTGSMGLAPGWGDIYEWNRGGNYVDFPTDVAGQPVAGYYLLRGVTDPKGLIAEGNDDDNHSYAMIEVLPTPAAPSLQRVRLLERGYGADPWDAAKKALTSTP
ncbi:MAG: hypothetical protein M3245_06615 [Actinomycetota bacterium]|nr:hypothetical protein [Actinomycetota bacterium]